MDTARHASIRILLAAGTLAVLPSAHLFAQPQRGHAQAPGEQVVWSAAIAEALPFGTIGSASRGSGTVTEAAVNPSPLIRAGAPRDERSARLAAISSHRGIDASTPVAACVSCHPMPDGLSHPTGVTPSTPLPKGLPLDDAGRLTCVTCHDLSWLDDPDEVGSPASLRVGGSNAPICGTCHDAMEKPHAAFGRTAHAGSRTGTGAGAAHAIDSESANCLGCHDGAVGADSDMGQPAGRPGGVDLGAGHSIGADYQEAVRAGRGGLESAPRSAATSLTEGKVGCRSCHSPFSKQAKQLVMSNGGSALCLSCHRR